MLSQPMVNNKFGSGMLQRYGSVLKGYSAALVLWTSLVFFALAARELTILWEPSRFLLKLDYVAAIPGWIIGYPALWLAQQLGQHDGFGLLLVEFSLLLLGFARIIRPVRSPRAQTDLAFGLAFLLGALLVWQFFQLYTPIAMDELF